MGPQGSKGLSDWGQADFPNPWHGPQEPAWATQAHPEGSRCCTSSFKHSYNLNYMTGTPWGGADCPLCRFAVSTGLWLPTMGPASQACC